MLLLVDLFGYLGIVLHGFTIAAQSVAMGGVLFLVAVARPFAARPDASAAAGAAPVMQGGLLADGDAVTGTAPGRAHAVPAALPAGLALRRASARVAGWGALALALCETLNVVMQSAVLVTTVDISWPEALGAGFAVAGMVKIACGLLLALLLLPPAWGRDAAGRSARVPGTLLLALCAVELAAATMTTHAAARLDDNALLLAMEFLHQAGAAIWVGGMPCFLLALARVRDGAGLARIGPAFSRLSMAGVACILVSGLTMSLYYIGSWAGVYGTAYGVMVAAKVAMFGMLLLLGLGNFLVTERMRRGAGGAAISVLRMRRFAEVELGIGITIFFTAASLTSVPPAIDLTQDRVTLHEIVERNAPVWPRLASPDHDRLGIPALQAQLDAEAAAQAKRPLPAFIEGSGTLPPRNADDIAWSEYNHHWSGLFLLAIGMLALLERAGARWARHWPLMFVGLGGFLLLRSDPEVWPLGDIGWFAAFRDVEVVQHRMFVVVIAVFGVFEWMVRTGRLRRPGFALVFPLMCAGGSALLFTHSHAIANVKDQLLIELTHTPVALAGIVAGWARWLQLRLPPGRATRAAGWVWPVAFALIGVLLVLYREA